MAQLVRDAVALGSKTPTELLPGYGRVPEPMVQGSVYEEYKDYPVGAVQMFTQVWDGLLSRDPPY